MARYKNTETPPDQIARELGGVDYILEGSLQREGDQIRIHAELIRVADQTQVWTEPYQRELSGILAIQREVARGVAGQLALQLLPAEEAQLADVRAVNPEAYEAYLKGILRYYRLTPADLDVALKYFELALEKDPKYALAYVGISLVWAGRSQMAIALPSEAAPKAKAAALKAVELDDNLAEAHAALAVVWTWHEWNLSAAEPEFKRAVSLNPSYPDAYAYYSHYLNICGRQKEAMAAIDRALALDPLNTLSRSFYAIDLVFAGRYDEAIAAARQAPDNRVALNAAWWALSLKGLPKEATAAAKAYLAFYSDRAIDEGLDQGLAQGGYQEATRRAAETLAARSRVSYVSPLDAATLYLDAGDKERAREWLGRAFEMRDPNVPYITVPFFARLRPDPRFQDLLRRIGLPQ
jgi:tetratricopeptide (TPR) repeat protein